MTIVDYPVPEGTHIEAGTPIALLENWWARFELRCNARGRVAKNLFDSIPGSTVPVSTPVSLVFFDPDDVREIKTLFELRHISDVRVRSIP